MAGNMSEVSEDANEENIKDKYIDTVSRFLLNREIRDVCTLNEMRSHFPSKYRIHDDVTVLYESFVMKRKLLKETVRRNIEEFYQKKEVKNTNKQQQSIEEKLAVLDVKRIQLKKDLDRAKKELSVLQNNMARCDKALKDCCLLGTDVKACFEMDPFEKLIVFTVNEHKNICIAGLNRQAGYATDSNNNENKCQ